MLRLLEAADGRLARVRLPGGLVSGPRLRVLAGLADELGDGRVELTSRGNVQLRGLSAGAAEPLTLALGAAGLLPSLEHDRVRNVLASPLAGLDGGTDLTRLVRALDAGLCARPGLAALPGRFLFAVDDGRGDVAGLGADVTATVTAGGAAVNGLVAGGGPDEVAAVMVAFAEAFLGLRAEDGDDAWRVADVPGGAERLRSAVAARLDLRDLPPDRVDCAIGADRSRRSRNRPGGQARCDRPGGQARHGRPVGLIGASAVVLAPLGRLTAVQLGWIADQLAGDEARVTPWRSVVLPRLPDAAATLRAAEGLGFGTSTDSPWARLTACAGRPGCASALADVQADAAGLAERYPGRLVHVSGCARQCGRPAGTEIGVTATSEGYQVDGV